jgi:hypothetical protein
MKELLKRKLSATKFSDLYTPAYATELIVPYLYGKIWECAAGEGHITVVLEKHVLDVHESDIAIGIDFLETKFIPPGIDFIVTNPPYDLKDEFLEHCYELEVPFALLLPLTALGGMKRNRLYRENGLEILIPSRRINFIYENAKKACWFHSAWFCWNVLPEKLMFVDMERNEM